MNPDLLSGLGQSDDAAVFRIADDRALIFTTDFFTPVVDDPIAYGAIAAVNSMSDVFAMGGDVLLALNIAGFPENLPEEMIIDIFRGGGEKVRDAGGVIVGGHTVDSKEPIYGLAVCGLVHPDRMMEKSGALPGDRLFLTKPLGTGIITTAFKGDLVSEEHLQAAVASMTALNHTASRAASGAGCRTATDITGFGLAGHALEIAKHSRVALKLEFGKLPFLPGTSGYADQWLFPAGCNRNRKAYEASVIFAETITEEQRMLIFNPETSGGLLIALKPESADGFLSACRIGNQPVWAVGEVLEGQPGLVVTQ